MLVLDVIFAATSALLSLLLPKRRASFAFTGRQYGGNTGPLFEAAAEHGIDAVWLTNRADVLRSGRTNVVSTRSLRGVWILARAEAIVLTHSLDDLWPLVPASRRTRVINVYHGMPIKRISRADPGFAQRRYAKRNLREFARYESMIATSDAMARIFADTFGLPVNHIYVTGQPRTDVLFKPAPASLNERYDPPLPAHRRKVLYCPTWRDGIATKLFPFADHDFAALERALEELDAVMFVRTHPNDPARLSERRGRVVPMQGDVVEEVTDVLPQFDALITDYSSVYYDYLLLDRPTIFLPYDLEQYAHSPGFYLPFEEIISGPCPSSFADFVGALKEALLAPAAHAERRRAVTALVHTFVDGKATARVLERIKSKHA